MIKPKHADPDFDSWYIKHFSQYPKEWRKHMRGDLYTLALLKLAFKAGKLAQTRKPHS